MKIKFFASLREITGKKEEELDVPLQTTLVDLLELLSSRHGKKFYNYVYDERTGKPKDHLSYLINGRSSSTLKGLKTKLIEGCSIAILPPVGGG